MIIKIDNHAHMMGFVPARLTTHSLYVCVNLGHRRSLAPFLGEAPPLRDSEKAEATKLDRASTRANKPPAMTQLSAKNQAPSADDAIR